MLISLSVLEYEPDLSEHLDDLAESEALSQIIGLIQTGRIHRVHIDVMRPPMIPRKPRFSVELMRRLYEALHKKVILAAHLMVENPFPIIERLNEFVPEEERAEMVIIIPRESFGSEEETIESLNLVKEYGYKAGICLDLPTPSETLTRKIMENVDTVLLMTVPMGRGGQKYSDEADKRIAYFSRLFPSKTIEVDGGIDPETIVLAENSGARIAVVGSFVTRNENPIKALLEIEQSLEHVQN
jgi:ribulose-phosphate 3-epimerase